MINNLSKLLTVQLSPLLAVISTFLILFAYLGPVPIFHESLNLVAIVPGSASSSIIIRSLDALTEGHRLPRAAALAVVARASSSTPTGPTIRFGLLGLFYVSIFLEPSPSLTL